MELDECATDIFAAVGAACVVGEPAERGRSAPKLQARGRIRSRSEGARKRPGSVAVRAGPHERRSVLASSAAVSDTYLKACAGSAVRLVAVADLDLQRAREGRGVQCAQGLQRQRAAGPARGRDRREPNGAERAPRVSLPRYGPVSPSTAKTAGHQPGAGGRAAAGGGREGLRRAAPRRSRQRSHTGRKLVDGGVISRVVGGTAFSVSHGMSTGTPTRRSSTSPAQGRCRWAPTT